MSQRSIKDEYNKLIYLLTYYLHCLNFHFILYYFSPITNAKLVSCISDSLSLSLSSTSSLSKYKCILNNTMYMSSESHRQWILISHLNRCPVDKAISGVLPDATDSSTSGCFIVGENTVLSNNSQSQSPVTFVLQ